MKIPKFFRSLSTRLLFLTLLWVSFIVSSIGWTMLLNWELEASAAAKFSIAELRMQVYRSAYFTQPIFPEKLLDDELTRVTNQFRVIRLGDAWQPLELPREGDFHTALETLENRWKSEVEPMLIASKEGSRQVDAEMVRVYTAELTDLADKIDAWRYDYLWQLRYLQILLIERLERELNYVRNEWRCQRHVIVRIQELEIIQLLRINKLLFTSSIDSTYRK